MKTGLSRNGCVVFARRTIRNFDEFRSTGIASGRKDSANNRATNGKIINFHSLNRWLGKQSAGKYFSCVFERFICLRWCCSRQFVRFVTNNCNSNLFGFSLFDNFSLKTQFPHQPCCTQLHFNGPDLAVATICAFLFAQNSPPSSAQNNGRQKNTNKNKEQIKSTFQLTASAPSFRTVMHPFYFCVVSKTQFS